jgi:aminoglycoside phosphotransferase family enzyme/predicted kinase
MHAHVDPALLAFLRDPASYPHRPREAKEVHTHASLVFLVPPFVYKIKKPVDFGFLDFSTLEKRRHFCQREVALNSRLAPGVYQGVVPVTRGKTGLTFGGDGPVVENAVIMRHLDPAGFLDTRIRNGSAGKPELEKVARTLADFYQKQPSPTGIAKWGSVGKLRISTDENFSQTRRFIGRTISREAFEAISAFTENCYEKRRALFDKRVADGWIRDCHGDLHLDHIHMTDGETVIYDCIEFNDRLRHLDVASDAAFLAMDLDFHDRHDLARFFIQRLAVLLEDPDMEALMDFYQCYRAYVRGKVESLHSVAEVAGDGERAASAEKARRHFQLALRYAVGGTRPAAIVCMGRVATGKSTLAAALSHELGLQVISSDTLRKTLAGVPLHIRGDAMSRTQLYAAGMTERTYDTLIREAGEIMRDGHGVILDATFSKRAFRNRLRESLGDANVKWVIAETDEVTARRRLLQRETGDHVVSDARLGDHRMLDAAFETPDELPPDTVLHLSTATGSSKAIGSLLIALAMRDHLLVTRGVLGKMARNSNGETRRPAGSFRE